MGTGLSKHKNESYVSNLNVTSHTMTAMKRHTNPFLLSVSQPRRERILETTVLSLFFYGLPNKPQDTPSRFRSKNATYIAHSGTNYKMGPTTKIPSQKCN